MQLFLKACTVCVVAWICRIAIWAPGIKGQACKKKLFDLERLIVSSIQGGGKRHGSSTATDDNAEAGNHQYF